MRALFFFALLVAGLPAQAQSQRVQAALEALFPEATRFAAKEVFLTDEVAARLQDLARTRISERLVTFYVATGGGRTFGYVVLHTHKVRTKNETLAVGFEPDGRIKRIDVALFLEPEEYEPPQRWLAQFDGASPASRLNLGDDLDVISGASLSARGVAETARWLLQVFKEAEVAAPERNL